MYLFLLGWYLNYLNDHVWAEVGKELPKQFPEPPPVRKLDVGNSALAHTAG